MKIIIKQMSVLNFKGIRELSIKFDNTTTISGRNASGKTTVFDAFTWLLFGKDSEDRKEFSIKTFDKNNVAIPRISHEVSATLLVNETEINLRRCYNEKWTKKRGSATEEFTGHEITQFVNDVPCSTKEYSAKIEEICPETIFKLITNPLHFTNQKKELQRQLLFDMAGGVTNDDVASKSEDFTELLAQLSGKTMEEYKREIATKKKKLKDELLLIPGRIDERHRATPEEQDWAMLETELQSKNEKIKDIDEQISNGAKKFEAVAKITEGLYSKVADLKQARSTREFDIREEVLKEFREQQSQRNAMKGRVITLCSEESVLLDNIKKTTQAISKHEAELKTYEQSRETLIKEWSKINSSTLTFSDNDFTCPTCKRSLEVADIGAKEAEMKACFNTSKAEKLEANKTKGMALKEQSTECNLQLNIQKGVLGAYEGQLSKIQEEASNIKENKVYITELTEPDSSEQIKADKDYIDLSNKITDIQNQINTEVSSPDNSELIEAKAVLNENIQSLQKELAKRTIIEANHTRVKELEGEQRTLAQGLADLEQIEFTITDFAKAKIEQVESKINNLFEFVKFKMYETQINGGEIETCEAITNGVPFSSQNNAMRTNMGLDIINAISKYRNVSAPIFIDNAESINKLISTQAQIIRLVVTEGSSLEIN